MTPDDQQLVQLITEKVIEALRRQGLVGGLSGQSPAATSRVEVHPPIGTCTGDYSKFPELAGRLGTAPPVAGGSPPASGANTQAVPAMATVALTGVVTATRLQEAMDAAPDGVAVLAPDARLSPLANDLLRQFPERMRRGSVSETAAHGTAQQTPWLAWVEGACPVANQVIAERAAAFVGTSASHHNSALPQVVRDLSSAVQASRVAGGVLFVPNAARAMCYLNRCASLRAVVGTCGEAVEQGVIEIGANVLVIEYPHHGHRAMAAMIDRVMQSPPAAPASVQRDLAELHRC